MKQNIEVLLRQALEQFAKQDGFIVPTELNFTIERPRDASHGDFSTNLALVFAKSVAMSPREFAQRLINHLPSHPDIEKVSIAGPGFINFTFRLNYLLSQLDMLWRDKACGVIPVNNAKTIVIDYSSPNLAKEMHVGHLRSTIIGDALARVLELKGHRVIRQNHVGDWGTQFGMLLAHLDDEEKMHPGDVQLNDLELFYKAAKQRFDNEPKFAERARQLVVLLQAGDKHCLLLWQTFIHLSIAHCQEIYQRLGVTLKPEDVRAESAYNDVLPQIVESLRKQEFLVENEGAKCVFLEGFVGKDNEPLPIIVQKKDGGYLYASTDLAAIQYRQSILHADRVLYVVDERQTLHFQQVFALAYQANFASPAMKLEHVNFGMVLDKSGKPFKSRTGGVTKLADLLDEAEKRAQALLASKETAESYPADELAEMAKIIGISAIKYADLSKNRTNDYVFDWDTMLSFEGNTAPYLLYANTRIHSLFQKAKITMDLLVDPMVLTEPQELTLAKQLVLFPEIIDAVSLKATPHLLCTFLYDLACLFSKFYEACPILNQENQSRLKLAGLTSRILEQGLDLLGIKTLKRM